MNNFLTRAVCFIVKGGFQVQEFYAFSPTLIYAHTSLGGVLHHLNKESARGKNCSQHFKKFTGVT